MVEIIRLIWDEWNVAHIAEHDVLAQEVEQACHSDPLVQQGNKRRTVVIGATRASRILEVVLDPEPEQGVYYVVTAHTASRKDRGLYQQEKGGEAA